MIQKKVLRFIYSLLYTFTPSFLPNVFSYDVILRNGTPNTELSVPFQEIDVVFRLLPDNK